MGAVRKTWADRALDKAAKSEESLEHASVAIALASAPVKTAPVFPPLDMAGVPTFTVWIEPVQLGEVDGIVREPQGGAHRNHNEAATSLGDAIEKELGELLGKSGEELRAERLARFRKMGAEYLVSAPVEA